MSTKKKQLGDSFAYWTITTITTITIVMACGVFGTKIPRVRHNYIVVSSQGVLLDPGQFPSYTVRSKLDCAAKCLSRDECKSFGFRKTQDEENSMKCLIILSNPYNLSTGGQNGAYFDIFTRKYL